MPEMQVPGGNRRSEQGLNEGYVAQRDTRRQEMQGWLDSGNSVTITMYGKTLTLDSNSIKIKGSEEAHAFNLLSNVAGGLETTNYEKFLDWFKDPNAAKVAGDDRKGDGYIGLGTLTLNFKKWGLQYGEAPGVTQVTDSADGFRIDLEDRMTSRPYRAKWAAFFTEMGIDVSDDTKLDAKIREVVGAILQDSSKYNVESHSTAYVGGHAEMGGICKEFFSIASEDFKSSNPVEVGTGVSMQGQWENKGSAGTTQPSAETEGGTTWATERFDIEFALPGETGTHTLSVGRATIGSDTASKYTVSIDGEKVGEVDNATLQAWGFTLDENRNLVAGNLDAEYHLWGPEILTDATKQRILANSYGAFGLASPENAQLPANSRQMLQDILAEHYATWAMTGDGQYTV